MKAHLVSLGCVRNLVDSEGMLGRLKQAGWQISDEPDDAHLIIVNTCSFIESAADESIDTILELAGYKKNGVCRSLIVTGCLPERYRENIIPEMPEADIFLGTGAFDKIVEAAEGILGDKACLLPDPAGIPLPDPDAPRLQSSFHTGYIKISEGCNKHCTYCIIPQLRGKQRSRPHGEIINEARKMIEAGTRELILIAQDTTGYGQDLKSETNLAGLLKDMAALSDDIWIRILYGHPESITVDTIHTIASHPNICSYYDLPIQHASEPVLKKMGRMHSRETMLRLFDTIRAADSEASLRTTAIVGFPGETERDFEELLSFAETIRFDHLGVFTYSDADDLPSHQLPDHVSGKTAEERYNRLMAVQLNISEEKNRQYFDKTLNVLVEESPEPNLLTGRTAFQAPEVDGIVYIHNAASIKSGNFIKVKINDTLEYDLAGESI